MLKATTAVAAAAGVMGVLASGAGSADTRHPFHRGSQVEVMVPHRGVTFEIGDTHLVSYFYGEAGACKLAVVMSETARPNTDVTSPGTRVIMPVVAGKRAYIDARNGQSAEFFCGPGAARMTARVFDRAPYKS